MNLSDALKTTVGDIMGQRREVIEGNYETVGGLVSDAVRALRLPTQSARGLDLEYTLRAGGSLLRPSDSLQDERVRDLLEQQDDNVVIPRLTAAY